MDFIIGSFITILILLASTFVFKNKIDHDPVRMDIDYSQSRLFELVKPMLPYVPIQKKPLVTQATKHFDKIHYRILFLDSKAYWIKENAIHMADVIDGNINKESTKTLDIINMDDVQLKRIQFIVDKLTEGL